MTSRANLASFILYATLRRAPNESAGIKFVLSSGLIEFAGETEETAFASLEFVNFGFHVLITSSSHASSQQNNQGHSERESSARWSICIVRDSLVVSQLSV